MARLLSAVGMLSLAAWAHPPACPPFSSWVEAHGRVYAPEELSLREHVYAINAASIYAHNSAGHNWFQACNAFSDLTPAEWRARFSGGYRRAPSSAGAAAPQASEPEAQAPLPTSLDWRDHGIVTRVKDQGSCGSCWSFSATGAIESEWALANKTLISLSEQQLMDCRAGGKGCDGGSPQGGFEIVHKTTHGACSEAEYPYHARDAACIHNCTRRAFLVGQQNVATDNEGALMSALSTRPISVAVEANEAVFQHYSHGVMDAPPAKCGVKLDHAVLLVGWGVQNTRASNGTEISYWIVKNSWGSRWGEKGYIRLARGANWTKHGQVRGGERGRRGRSACAYEVLEAATHVPRNPFFSSQCGVQMDPSYPIAKR